MFGLVAIVVLYCYVRLAIWLAKWIAGKCESSKAKWIVRIAVTSVFVLIPTGDVIVGRIYLNHLCSTETGVKIYQTVELPAEYWDEQGRPKFFAANGFVDMKLLPNRYQWHNLDEPYVDSVIKIEKWRWQLMDKETKNILGERITYMRHFGWLNLFSPAPNIGEGCELDGQNEKEQEQNFFRKIFKPAESTR
jgi:hypothetical protein